MNFLACDGSWTIGAGGESICSGTPVTITGEELRTELLPQPLTIEDAVELKDFAIGVFVAVFCVLVLRKAL